LTSKAVSSDAFGQLEILGHYCHSLSVDGAQVGVLKKRNEIGLSWFLKGKDGLTLETNFLLELGGNLAHQPLERQFSDQQVSLFHKNGTLFWNLRIYRRATVPGLKRWGFLRPETMGALFLAIFWAASCFLGTFWAVDFLAVCFVLAIK